VTIRVPKWLPVGLAAVIVLGAAATGVWYFLIRDTGPSEAELAAEEEAQEQAEAEALAEECEQQLGSLLTVLEDLNSRLGVGIDYQEYGDRVGDIRVAYDQTPIRELDSRCVTDVGLSAEDAMNSYVKAGNLWEGCITDFGCDTDEIQPELQSHWSEASTSIREASQGLDSIRSP
jgi:hypothetical protein